MESRLNRLRSTINELSLKRQISAQELNRSKIQKRNKTSRLKRVEEAKEVLRHVAMQTQSQLQVQVSSIATLALEAIFEEQAYELLVEFVRRRDKTEADLWFVNGEERVEPMNGTGGGAVDVAAFALRVAFHQMRRGEVMNTIILDEPFRFLDTTRQEAASRMLKELSEKLGVQFIIVTHEKALEWAADKVFAVEKDKNGVSNVIEKL